MKSQFILSPASFVRCSQWKWRLRQW